MQKWDPRKLEISDSNLTRQQIEYIHIKNLYHTTTPVHPYPIHTTPKPKVYLNLQKHQEQTLDTNEDANLHRKPLTLPPPRTRTKQHKQNPTKASSSS